MSFFETIFPLLDEGPEYGVGEPPEEGTECPSESRSTLKSEHLNKGIKPIIACVGTPVQFDLERREQAYQSSRSNNSNAYDIDYYGNPEYLKSQRFKNAGFETYVISAVDGSDKYSIGYKNCTGLVVAGKDKETGGEISFLSHEDPEYFLREDENRSSFINDLRERLGELKDRCVDGTIDAVIVGGNYFTDPEVPKFRKDYLESIAVLSTEVSKILGFEPVVMTGPKVGSGGNDNVIYQNDDRRLFIMRPTVGNATTESYTQSNIKGQEKKWQREDVPNQ